MAKLPATEAAELDDFDRLLEGFREKWSGFDLDVEDDSVHARAAQELRNMRKALGLTQRALAEATGLKQGQISRYEDPDYSGHKFGMVARIARAVGWRLSFRLEPREPRDDSHLAPVALALARGIILQLVSAGAPVERWMGKMGGIRIEIPGSVESE